MKKARTSLAAQWLGLQPSIAAALSSIPGQGTNLQTALRSQKKKEMKGPGTALTKWLPGTLGLGADRKGVV